MHGDEHEAAHAHKDRAPTARRRPAGLERARRRQRARDMGLPQRERIRIGRRDGELVGDRGRRTVRHAAAAIEPAQAPRRRRACAGTRAGSVAATASDANATSPAARGQAAAATATAPSQDTVRNRPTTAASGASAGHSRSQKMLQRARQRSASRVALPTSLPRGSGAGSGKVASVNQVSATMRQMRSPEVAGQHGNHQGSSRQVSCQAIKPAKNRNIPGVGKRAAARRRTHLLDRSRRHHSPSEIAPSRARRIRRAPIPFASDGRGHGMAPSQSRCAACVSGAYRQLSI